jgi:hypothetical protein
LATAVQKLLVNVAITDITRFMPVVLAQEETPFIDSLVTQLLEQSSVHNAVLVFYLQSLPNFTLTEQSAKIMTFAVLPVMARHGGGIDSDLLLLWVMLVGLSVVWNAAQSGHQNIAFDCLSKLNGCFADVFARLSVVYTPITQATTTDHLAQQISVPFIGLSFECLASFIGKRTTLDFRRTTPPRLTIFVTLFLVHIFEKLKISADSIAVRFMKEICILTVSGTDECCRAITKKLAELSLADLKRLDVGDISILQSAALRSLIKPQDETQKENLLFLVHVLLVAPPEVIKPEKERLLNTITRCFEFETVENLLDAINAIIASDTEFDQFTNMSQISLPRILTLSVNENAQIRAKANVILRFVGQARDDSSIVHGLVKVFGIQEVGVLADFFLDWTAKVDLNIYSMTLLGRLFDGISGDQRLATGFTKKLSPILLKILNGVDSKGNGDRRPIAAFEMLTRLLGVPREPV